MLFSVRKNPNRPTSYWKIYKCPKIAKIAKIYKSINTRTNPTLHANLVLSLRMALLAPTEWPLLMAITEKQLAISLLAICASVALFIVLLRADEWAALLRCSFGEPSPIYGIYRHHRRTAIGGQSLELE